MTFRRVPPVVRFDAQQHLRSGADFRRIYAEQCKAADGTLLIFGSRNTLGRTRIGLSVSKKHGGAVLRNRLKRLLREAFRLTQTDLPLGWDYVLIPLDSRKATLAAYQQSLRQVTARLARRGR